MDSTPELPPADAPLPAEPPAQRPARRRWIATLLALHALAIVAAAVVLARGPRAAARGNDRLKLLVKPEDSVGWLSIRGVIRDSESSRSWGEAGVGTWTRRLRAMADKPEVKAIVLDINSPGGTVGAVQELYSAVERVRKEKGKPVVALLGDVAASGGYYVASGCDRVVAHPGSLVGSIGVIFETVNVEGLLKKIGVRSDPIKSGPHKDIGSPTRPMTPEERRILQALIDDAYGQFLDAVMRGRGLTEAEARPLADGRVFTGAQAKMLRLVDQIGDSRDALAVAGKLGGISGTPKVLREGDSLDNLWSLLESSLPRGLRPDSLVGALADAGPSLEYRWTGF